MSENDDKYFDLFAQVFEFFGEDLSRTCEWWLVPNPHLGEESPQSLQNLGKYEKLKDFIETQLEENKRIDNNE